MLQESFRTPISTVIQILVIVGLMTSCAGLKSDRTIASERAQAYVSAHPKLDPKTAEAITSNAVLVGMTMEQVAAAWGTPAEIQKFRGGKVQHWFFGCDWPHVCDSEGGSFVDPNRKFQSQALFQNGVVVEWWS